MNRRSIFKTTAGALCASAIEVCGVEPTMPKVGKVVANPEWMTAEYEDFLLACIDPRNSNYTFVRVKREMGATSSAITLDDPMKGIYATQIGRSNLIDGQYVEVYPYIVEEI